MKTKVKKTKAAMLDRPEQKSRRPEDFVSTGLTLLNLGCTGKINRGFLKGCYYLLVGDSMSAKTWICASILTEAAINSNFDDYQLIYDDVENGMLMDLEKFFKPLAKRILPPTMKSGSAHYSETVEDFYINLLNALKRGPCVYVLDSMDALESRASIKKFDQNMAAIAKDGETKGSFGDGKAKENSQRIRRISHLLRKSGSILIVISQTRDALGQLFVTKTRSGGRSLRFYATIEMWSSISRKLKRTVRGKEREIGSVIRWEIQKNRVAGRNTSVEVPIYWSYGLDDIGSMCLFLVEEKHWPTSKSDDGKVATRGKTGITEKTQVNAPEFQFQGSLGKLIRHIEENKLEKDLRIIVTDVWRDIEKSLQMERKPRYS